MDPMTMLEEQKRAKEELARREFLDVIKLSDQYFNTRDLANKGRDVVPSGRQMRDLQTMEETIRFNVQPLMKRRSGSMDDGQFESFDENIVPEGRFLTSKPRLFVDSGPINKKEPENLIRKTTRKFIFLFTDMMLITVKKDGVDQFECQQILWVKDLRLRHLDMASEEDPCSFEILINKNRNRARSSVIFVCDTEESKRNWVLNIENVLLAYHRETDLSNQVGWFHEVIQGTFFSAAYLGDVTLLKKYLKAPSLRNEITSPDKSSMFALHWAALRGHEVCVRMLLDHDIECDLLQGGNNTPFLLAVAAGHETIARLLLDRGADLFARNTSDYDAVFMLVLFGHASKGLPWTLQMLNARCMDLNNRNSSGATPLHCCAERNLSRPVRILVDSGADVNVKHGKYQLTPLQMACIHDSPDVETIRSFLDKGAYVNWKDVQGRTAFSLVMQSYKLSMQTDSNQTPSSSVNTGAVVPPAVFGFAGSRMDVDQLMLASHSTDDKTTNATVTPSDSMQRPSTMSFSDPVISPKASSSSAPNLISPTKWRPMKDTIEKVGDWAVKCLPALLEITKRGGRFEPKDIECLRPSFRAAVLEAKNVWDTKQEAANFHEFVLIREQNGEDLRLHKESWTKDSRSNNCQLCSDAFNLTNRRRHHCRACGVLTCDSCSTKRLQLSVMDAEDGGATTSSASNSKDFKEAQKKKEERQERVCDGCFNRLCHEASQPSPDHFRVKQLKQCALDVIQSIELLIDSLDDPEGDPNCFQASVRETMALTRGLDNILQPGAGATSRGNFNVSTNNNTSGKFITPTKRSSFSTPVVAGRSASPMPKSGEALIDVLKIREARLHRSEDIIAKFIEAADGYHRTAKKLIEQKATTPRMWTNK